MKKTILLLLLSFICFFDVNSQTEFKNIKDSLEYQLFYENVDKYSKSYKFLELNKLLKDNKNIIEYDSARYYLELSKTYLYAGTSIDSAKYYLDLSDKIHNFKPQIKVEIYIAYGSYYMSTNNDIKSLFYFDTVSKITTDSVTKIEAQLGMVNIYYSLKQCNKSLDLISKAINSYKKNIGNVPGFMYYLKANSLKRLNIKDSSLFYYEKALLSAKNEKYTYLACECLSNLGETYNEIGLVTKSNTFFEEGLNLCKKGRDKVLIYRVYGRILSNRREYEKAESLFKKIIDSDLVKTDIKIRKDLYYDLFILYKETNRAKKSLNSYIIYTELKDSINKIGLEENLAEIEAKYQTEKSEKEILVLSQQKLEQDKEIAEQNLANNNKQLLIYGLLGGLLVLMGLGYFIYNRKKLQQAKERAEVKTEISQLEQKALKTQINTHFIFNAIDVAQGFIAKDNYQEARRCLVDVTRLVRLILENASETTVSLEDEISCLEAYLEVSQMLNKDKFTYQINVPMGIDESNVSLPPMLIQPFIENAIVHGALPNDELTSILINFEMKDSVLTCVIQDDGVGREAKSENKNPFKRKSMGMSITKNRIEKNNESFGVESTINFTDLIGEKLGTKVSFKIATTSVY